MKVIITENQYKYLVENINPCPEGKKEDELITLDDVKNGKIIPKGYCNSKPGSALVKIQRLLQDKGYLDTKSNNGYYGDKTQKAIQKLWNPDTVKGIEIGKKTLEKLGTDSTKPKELNVKSGNKFESTEKEAKQLFNKLNYNQKLVVTTLLYEAGGEINRYGGMLAVAKVLKKRANKNFGNFGTTMAKQAIAKNPKSEFYQFSCWNDGIQNALQKQEDHTGMKMAIYIMNNVDNLPDNTGGAEYYFTGKVPYWAKETKDSTWVETTKVGNHIFGYVVKKKKNK
jgi:peptidoglycan hydrolase-like protein with peptidoglycan-binding domain